MARSDRRANRLGRPRMGSAGLDDIAAMTRIGGLSGLTDP
jgi:hypothetical protein